MPNAEKDNGGKPVEWEATIDLAYHPCPTWMEKTHSLLHLRFLNPQQSLMGGACPYYTHFTDVKKVDSQA